KSLQNWVIRKDYDEYKEKDASGNLNPSPVNIGEIFIADLGLSYETAYSHPVLILEHIDNRVLVIPVTSSPSKFSRAFHPSSFPHGDKSMRIVYKSDGFETDSVLMVSSAITISKGRLLERKGKLNEDITSSTSIYNEVRNTLFDIM